MSQLSTASYCQIVDNCDIYMYIANETKSIINYITHQRIADDCVGNMLYMNQFSKYPDDRDKEYSFVQKRLKYTPYVKKYRTIVVNDIRPIQETYNYVSFDSFFTNYIYQSKFDLLQNVEMSTIAKVKSNSYVLIMKHGETKTKLLWTTMY